MIKSVIDSFKQRVRRLKQTMKDHVLAPAKALMSRAIRSRMGTAYVEYFILAAVMAAMTVWLWNENAAIQGHYDGTMFQPAMTAIAGPVSPP